MKKSGLIMFAGLSMLFLNTASRAQFAQQWSESYQHTFSQNFSNESRKVVVDNAGGFIYTLVDVTSDLDPTGNVTGLTYCYTVLNQYSTNGSFLNGEAINVESHTGSGFDRKSGFGLELDASGNVYVGHMSHDAVNEFDVNIAKYSNTLTLVWNYKFNPITSDIGVDLKVTPTGQAYAIVVSTAIGGVVRNRIIKATAGGTSTSTFYNFNAYPDFLNSIAIDANLDIYVTGYRLLNNVKSILTAGIGSAGNLKWIRTDNCGTTTGDDIGKHITIGADGFIALTGSSTGTAQHGIDVVTFRINPVTGKKVWENFINFNLNDGGVLVASPDNNYVYVCWNAANTVYVEQIVIATGLASNRAAYSPIPSAPYTTLNGATVSDMKISTMKNIYLTGNIAASNSGQNYSASFLIKINFTSRGSNRIELTFPVRGDNVDAHKSTSIDLYNFHKDVYMLEDIISNYVNHNNETVQLLGILAPGVFRTADVGISASEDLNLFSVSPNPATSVTMLNSKEAISAIELFDIAGKSIFELPTQNESTFFYQLDMTPFSQGTYLTKITTITGETQIQKIIKN